MHRQRLVQAGVLAVAVEVLAVVVEVEVAVVAVVAVLPVAAVVEVQDNFKKCIVCTK